MVLYSYNFYILCKWCSDWEDLYGEYVNDVVIEKVFMVNM